MIAGAVTLKQLCTARPARRAEGLGTGDHRGGGGGDYGVGVKARSA